MKWSECYGKGQKPDFAAVEAFVGETLWGEFHAFMEANCPAAPKFEYSACTMQTGWNIKYKKAGKNVCTVYPMDGYLICMILIGGDGALEAEARLDEFTPYVRELYRGTRLFNGSRWLFMEVKSREVLRDLEELVYIRLRCMGITPGPVTKPAGRARTGGKAKSAGSLGSGGSLGSAESPGSGGSPTPAISPPPAKLPRPSNNPQKEAPADEN